jgi:hypothetical protein
MLTDLSRIFVETLDQAQIRQRALAENTSIDPSEDDSQLDILLEKIRSSLAGEANTSLRFLKGRNHDDFVLRTTCSLPAPFGILIWPIHLTLQIPEMLADEVILPALSTLHTWSNQTANLISQIHDKDHVISKLLDRLEQSATDISTVFPGVTGLKSTKKATSREQAARHVKGLGQFDFDAWQSVYEQTGWGEEGGTASIDNISDCRSMTPTGKPQYGAWWTSLDDNSAYDQLDTVS